MNIEQMLAQVAARIEDAQKEFSQAHDDHLKAVAANDYALFAMNTYKLELTKHRALQAELLREMLASKEAATAK